MVSVEDVEREGGEREGSKKLFLEFSGLFFFLLLFCFPHSFREGYIRIG
jgi:hypothetical protein